MHHMSMTSHGTSILEPFWGGERGTSALYKRMKQRYQIPNVLGYFLGCPLLVTRLPKPWTKSSAKSAACNQHIIIDLGLNLGPNPQPSQQPVTSI